MRRRWRWPILRKLAGADEFDWIMAWLGWMIVGLLVLLTPAMIVDTDANDQIHMGTYLLVAVIVYVAPLAAGVLAGIATLVRFVVHEYGRDLLPRRVVEPVEDLRERYRG